MYLVLDTSTFAHEVNKAECQQHDGFLPEPRNEQENEFLNGLNTQMFPLGINDSETEGSWVFNSDGSPVVYQNWRSSRRSQRNLANCAQMFRHYLDGGATWGDYPCDSDSFMESLSKSLICQKNGGMHLVIVSVFTLYQFEVPLSFIRTFDNLSLCFLFICLSDTL